MKKRQYTLSIVALLLLALALRCFWVIYTRFIIDDAFITFRYAEQVASGNGFTYNRGEQVYGTTTPAFTFLLALWVALFPGKIAVGAWLFDLLSSLASMVLLAVILQRAGFTWPRQAIVLGFLALSVNVYRMDMAGMETSLVILLMMACWLVLGLEHPVWAGLLAGCLLWTRIDTIFWVLALFLFCTPKKAFVFGAAASLTYLPWVLFATRYFGSPVPFTLVAKSVAYAVQPAQVPGHLVTSLVYLSPLRLSPVPLALALGSLTLGVAFWQAAFLAKQKAWGMLPLFMALELARLVLSGATMFMRYFAPLAWVVWVLFALGLSRAWQQNKFFRELPSWVPRFCLLGSALVLLLQGVNRATALRSEQAFRHEGSLKAIGLWLKANASPEATVLLEPLGYIGYYAGLHMLDEVGLVTPAVVTLKRQGISGSQYYAYLKPDYLVVHCDDALALRASPPANRLLFPQAYRQAYVSNPLGFDPRQAVQETDEIVCTSADGDVLQQAVLARNSCYEIWKLVAAP